MTTIIPFTVVFLLLLLHTTLACLLNWAFRSSKHPKMETVVILAIISELYLISLFIKYFMQ